MSIPHYLLDDSEDDELDDFILQTIFEMSGAMPSSSFAFEPVWK